MRHCSDVNMPLNEVIYVNQAACLSIIYKRLWDSEVVYVFSTSESLQNCFGEALALAWLFNDLLGAEVNTLVIISLEHKWIS